MKVLKVLGRLTSINVRKVVWAADEMGLAYEREDWGLPIRDPKVPEFLALNPNAQVPVLLDDGFVLWESAAILRYLAARETHGIRGNGTKDMALIDQWMTWQGSELNPAWVYPVMALLRKNPAFNDVERIKAGIAAWTTKMQILDAQIEKQGGVVVGETFSLADIVCALSTHRWVSTPFDKPDMPAAMAHYRQMQSRPAGGAYLGATTP